METNQAGYDFWKESHQLISFQNGNMTVNEEVLEALSHVKSKISVICIIGTYRKGKSYFMNRMLQQKGCFEVRADLNSCTKGIWIQAKTHPKRPAEKLLALDTQGLFSIDNNENDLKVLSFALLVCNCLIYNVPGIIDTSMVQLLDLTTAVVEKIKPRDFSPQMSIPLVVLLRDSTLFLKIKGEPITPDEYLERALKSCKPEKKPLAEYFSPRKCFVLPIPVRDTELLKQELEALSDDKLSKEFLDGCNAAIDTILAKANEHSMGSTAPVGKDFVEVVRQYVLDINGGKVPVVKTLKQYVQYENSWAGWIEKWKQWLMANIDNATATVKALIKEIPNAMASFDDWVAQNSKYVTEGVSEMLSNKWVKWMCVGIFAALVIGGLTYFIGPSVIVRTVKQALAPHIEKAKALAVTLENHLLADNGKQMKKILEATLRLLIHANGSVGMVLVANKATGKDLVREVAVVIGNFLLVLWKSQK